MYLYILYILWHQFAGELPVGQSIIIQTYHPKHKYLIYSPTMRVAENIENSINSYLAFRSALILMEKHKITSASTPLFCSGAGGMTIKQTCLQMLEAYKSVITKNLCNKDWKFYHSNHRYIKNLGK